MATVNEQIQNFILAPIHGWYSNYKKKKAALVIFLLNDIVQKQMLYNYAMLSPV